jgi:hypothetical protein
MAKTKSNREVRKQRIMQIVFVIVSIILILSWVLSLVVNT